MTILNLTQHVATPSQIEAGVLEPSDKTTVKNLLTFHVPPTSGVLVSRAEDLAFYAKTQGCEMAMIGGAPYLMAPLEKELRAVGIEPVYSFSKRTSIDAPQADGSIHKVSIFVHEAWVTCP